ncbi:MAG: redoxin domain-containing protein [Actinobacteria bacterium]|nr:redoxin domain-containing protein [Actinomycetota bacterium]
MAPLALGSLALLLSACGGLTKDTGTSESGNPPAAGATASTFTAQRIGGGSIQLPGARPSVVLFFSVECGGCGPTAKALADAQAADPAAADFAVVDVAGYETANDVESFLRANSATSLAYARDTEGDIFTGYGVTALSTVIIVDTDRRVAYRAVEPSADTIRTELDKLAN